MEFSFRSGSVVRWFVIILLAAITVNGWRVVFTVSRGEVDDLGGMASMYELWNSSSVANDNPAGFHQASLSYMSPYQPTYKSSIVNKWHEHNIKYVKLGIYRDGQEGAFVVFDANGTDKNSWFNSSLLLKSSYTDLDTTIRTKFSLQGSHSDLRFSALQESGGICKNPAWFAVVDRDIRSFCLNQTENTPYFVYSPHQYASLLTNGTIGNAFAIFIDDCVVNPCEQGGTCFTQIEGHACQCIDQVFGHNCQYDCPCEQRAECLSINNTHINSSGNVYVNGVFINDQYMTLDQNTKIACKCPPHYYGDKCQNTTLQCASSPCLNQGVCVEGISYFTCECTGDYEGKRCEVPKPVPQESGINIGAKVALGLCLPLIFLIILAVIFIVYTFKNPEAYGHEATVKQYTIAREFVRRSIRRMSGRRPKQSQDTAAFSTKEEEVHEGQVNLGFDDAVKGGYERQSSEYYDLSATDNAVVSRTTSKFPTDNSRSFPKRQDTDQEQSDFYKEYRPAQLHSGDNFTHPDHRHDRDHPPQPVPQPRQQRQTGRRGRQTTESSQPATPSAKPSEKETNGSRERKPRPSESSGGYDGQILSPRSFISDDRPGNDTNIPTYDSRSRLPPYDSSRIPSNYGRNYQEEDSRRPRYNENSTHQQSNYNPANQRANYDHYDRGHMRGDRYNSQDRSPGPSPDDRYNLQDRSPGPNPGDRYNNLQDRSPGPMPERSPGYRGPERSQNVHQTPRNNEWNTRNNHNQTPPKYSTDNRDPQFGTYSPDNYRGQRSDERIVFTSSEPMDDVTV